MGAPWMVGLAAPPALAALADLLLVDAAAIHAILVASTALLAEVVALVLAGRPILALGSGAAILGWSLVYQMPVELLAIAIAVALVALAPPGPAPLLAALGAALAGAGAFVLIGNVVAVVVAATAAAGASLACPRAPTREQISWMRTGSITAPALGLGAAYALNVASKWGEDGTARDAVATGVGLFALLALFGLGALGLTTLVESSEPRQRQAWTASAAWAGLFIATLFHRDPGLTLAVGAVGAGIVVPLAFVAAQRSAAVSGRARFALLALPLVLTWSQFALGSA